MTRDSRELDRESIRKFMGGGRPRAGAPTTIRDMEDFTHGRQESRSKEEEGSKENQQKRVYPSKEDNESR